MASFASLPPELIQRIALFVLIYPTTSPPALLLSLFQLNSRFYHFLNPAHNHALYASLFKAFFDSVSIIRRLAPNHSPCRFPHSLANPRLSSSSSSPEIILHHSPLNPFPRPSHHSRHSPTATEPEPDNGLLDTHFSAAYLERMALFRRMRAFAALPPPPDTSPGQMPPPVDLRDLWLIYLMVMESDGRNMDALVETAAAPRFMRNYFLYCLCPPETDALADFPQATPEIALGFKLCHLFLDLPLPPLDLLPATIDSRLGPLKPFNFACHRVSPYYPEPAALLEPDYDERRWTQYDLAYAPWMLRDLPLAGCESPATLPVKMTAHDRQTLARLQPPGAAVAIGHACELAYMGRRLTLLAPLVSHVASVSFFWVTRHPLKRHADLPDPPDPLTNLMRRPLSLRSTDYDLDFARARACVDPFRAPGLPFDAFEGCFGGQWTGKFGFMEYGSYKELLGGNVESLLKGRYGSQPQSFQLAECLVRLRDARAVRFPAGTRAQANGAPTESRLVGRVMNEAKYLLGLPTPDAKDLAAPEEVLFEPGETYELQIHGSGHSNWGDFHVKGRVRGWDGLVTFIKVYRQVEHGRWLYRGYYSAGDMIVGRWKPALSEDIEGDDEGAEDEEYEDEEQKDEEEEDQSQHEAADGCNTPGKRESSERLDSQGEQQGCGERSPEGQPQNNIEDGEEEAGEDEKEGFEGTFIMCRL